MSSVVSSSHPSHIEVASLKIPIQGVTKEGAKSTTFQTIQLYFWDSFWRRVGTDGNPGEVISPRHKPSHASRVSDHSTSSCTEPERWPSNSARTDVHKAWVFTEVPVGSMKYVPLIPCWFCPLLLTERNTTINCQKWRTQLTSPLLNSQSHKLGH
jgi:hypothetical protein